MNAYSLWSGPGRRSTDCNFDTCIPTAGHPGSEPIIRSDHAATTLDRDAAVSLNLRVHPDRVGFAVDFERAVTWFAALPLLTYPASHQF